MQNTSETERNYSIWSALLHPKSCSAASNPCVGTDGDDDTTGDDGTNSMHGKKGNDLMNGGGANDGIYGNEGDKIETSIDSSDITNELNVLIIAGR